MPRLRKWKRYSFGLVMLITIGICWYNSDFNGNLLKAIDRDRRKKLIENYAKLTKNQNQELIDIVSTEFQNELENIHRTKNCSQPMLYCKFDGLCGFGCKIHHYIACLMTAYALKIPMLQEKRPLKPYLQTWSDIFEPAGSECDIGAQEINLLWSIKMPQVANGAIWKDYPLKFGVHVPKKQAELVEKIHPNPWLFWVGQFTNYALRLNRKTMARLTEDRTAMGFKQASLRSRPIVGLHVRRTDKTVQAKYSYHGLNEYFTAANAFFKDGGSQNVPNKSVFIASDSSAVLKQLKKQRRANAHKQLQWNILFYEQNDQPATEEQADQRNRRDLYLIVRDLLTLTDCDHVVCGFSSNICKLLLEMKSSDMSLGTTSKIQSLDGEYSYRVVGHVLNKTLVYI